MDPKSVKPRPEKVDWKRGEGAVGEYLAWLVAGTLHGLIRFE